MPFPVEVRCAYPQVRYHARGVIKSPMPGAMHLFGKILLGARLAFVYSPVHPGDTLEGLVTGTFRPATVRFGMKHSNRGLRAGVVRRWLSTC